MARQSLPPHPSSLTVNVNERHLATVFFFFFNYFVGVEGRYCCSYWHKITPSSLSQGHCRGMVSGSMSARRCQSFWGRLGEPDASREGEGSAARSNMSFCQSCLVFWCVDCFFFMIEEEEPLSFPAFCRPCETPIFVCSSHTGRLSHRARASWTRIDWAPHIWMMWGAPLMWRVAPVQIILFYYILFFIFFSIYQLLISPIYFLSIYFKCFLSFPLLWRLKCNNIGIVEPNDCSITSQNPSVTIYDVRMFNHFLFINA